PDHDTVDAESTDTVSTDVAADIALALFRAQELATKNPMALATATAYPFEAHADEVIAALNGSPSLWDKDKGGYFAGLSLGTNAVVMEKTTRANAELLAVIHRGLVLNGTPYTAQIKTLRQVLTDRLPENSSLLSIVSDQTDYLERSTAAFAPITTAN